VRSARRLSPDRGVPRPALLVVSERAREIALRLALGAAPRQVMRLVMTGAARLLAGGLVLGMALTTAADRVLRGVVFAASPLDVPALAAAAATLAIAATVAVAGPAFKAARIEPIDALRASELFRGSYFLVLSSIRLDHCLKAACSMARVYATL
jgi:hypothetical protein